MGTKKNSLTEEIWERIKKLGVKKTAAPDPNSKHPQSILSFPVPWRTAKIRRLLAGDPNRKTNHDRVVAGRAEKLGISVEDYRRKFPRRG